MADTTVGTQQHDIGDGLRIYVEFRDLDDALVDPTTVTCKLRNPKKVQTTLVVNRSGIGEYFTDVVIPDVSGVWKYKWQGTGPGQAAEEGKFNIRETDFT